MTIDAQAVQMVPGVQGVVAPTPRGSSGFRLRAITLLLPGALLLAGCTRKETQGDLTIVTYEAWVGLVAILIGLVVAVVSLLMRKSGIGAWIVAIAAVAFTVGFAPFGFVDYVRVDKEHIATRWGFWFVPTLHDIRFDDIAKVDYTKETRRGRRGRKETSYNLVFSRKSGEQEKLTATNSLMQAASDELVDALSAKGLAINDLTGD